jgi:hypothetical protein
MEIAVVELSQVTFFQHSIDEIDAGTVAGPEILVDENVSRWSHGCG